MTTEISPPRPTLEAVSPPDPEVLERPKRRRFTAEYRMSIVRQADACTHKGEVGALLRREGLYSSYLTQWRQQRDRGGLDVDKKRGRKPGRRTNGDMTVSQLMAAAEFAKQMGGVDQASAALATLERLR